jgi:hypothetical protein
MFFKLKGKTGRPSVKENPRYTSELEVEVRWIRSTETRFSAGLLVVKQPADRSLERYTGHIAGRG